MVERHFKLASDGSGARGNRLPPALEAAAAVAEEVVVVEEEAVLVVEEEAGLLELQEVLQKVGRGRGSRDP